MSGSGKYTPCKYRTYRLFLLTCMVQQAINSFSTAEKHSAGLRGKPDRRFYSCERTLWALTGKGKKKIRMLAKDKS